MSYTITTVSRSILALAFAAALSACGQKTPLEIDQPAAVQEDNTSTTTSSE